MDLTDLFPFAPDVGYLSLGLVSFFGSLIPFVPLPSFLILASMAAGDKFDLHIMVFLSALLSTAAKQIIFMVSFSGRKIIHEKTRKRMKPFERLVKRYGAAAAFVAAATPIPDDMVYVPLGLARYNPLRFFIATFTGKVVLHYIIVLIAHFLGLSLIEPYLENINDPTPVYVGFVIFTAMMVSAIVLLLRLDWAKILGRFAPWTVEPNSDEKNS